jgi:hypothetical protein
VLLPFICPWNLVLLSFIGPLKARAITLFGLILYYSPFLALRTVCYSTFCPLIATFRPLSVLLPFFGPLEPCAIHLYWPLEPRAAPLFGRWNLVLPPLFGS